MLITSLDNKSIKNVIKLRNKKYRDLENEFVVDIINVIKEAKKENLLQELYVKEDTKIDIDFDYTYVSEDVFNKIKEVSTTNVIGVINKPKEGILKGSKYILLDGISDPGNLGTIIRSALAFNIDTLVLGDNTVDLYNDKVIRATEGAIFRLNIVKMNLIECIEKLKEKNIKVYGTNVVNGTDIKNIKEEKAAIIMGNEGNGLSKEIKDLNLDNIYIKTNNVESLNVGVATSIIMYELDNK